MATAAAPTFVRQRLREAIAYQGRLNQWIAERTEYSESYVAKVLSGNLPLTEPFVIATAKALDIPSHFFVSEVAA